MRIYEVRALKDTPTEHSGKDTFAASTHSAQLQMYRSETTSSKRVASVVLRSETSNVSAILLAEDYVMRERVVFELGRKAIRGDSTEGFQRSAN